MRPCLSSLIMATIFAAFAPGSVWAKTDDEIVVTAIDRSQDTPVIPASIIVINDPDRIAPVHPAEALNNVAGVNIHRGSGQEHLTAIRSPVLTGGAGAGSFLYLEDGVPLRAAGFANVNGLFEAGTEMASGLEVFKGPGPVYYGSNAVHGLINVFSRPVEGDDIVRIMGNEDGFVSLMASKSRGDFRASLSLAHDDGFRAESGFDQQKLQMRYQGQWQAWDIDWLSSFQNLNQETAGFIQGPDAYKDPAAYLSNPNPEAFRDGRSYRTQLSLTRDVGSGELVLTPYARRAELRFLRHFVPGQALEKNGHHSFGLRTEWFSDHFTLGGNLEWSDGFLYEFQNNPDRFSFVQGLHFDYQVEALVAAAYARKNISLGPQTTLDIGVRAEHTDYSYDNQADVGSSGRFIRVADRSDAFFSLTPKATLSHEFGAGSLIYARAARGSRAPQVTDLYSLQQNQTAGETQSEVLDSVEVGLKHRFNKGGIELAGFAMWKDNFFFRNANGFNVTNGKTKHEGIELSSHISPTQWLRLSLDGTLARHSYDFTDNVSSPSSSITTGDRVDSAPDTLATGRITLTPTEAVMAELEWRHVGSYFTDPGNTQSYPGHDIFVLRGGYDLSDMVRIFGRVDNLFDRRYADRADFAFGNERYFPGRPRTLFLGLTSTF